MSEQYEPITTTKWEVELKLPEGLQQINVDKPNELRINKQVAKFIQDKLSQKAKELNLQIDFKEEDSAKSLVKLMLDSWMKLIQAGKETKGNKLNIFDLVEVDPDTPNPGSNLSFRLKKSVDQLTKEEKDYLIEFYWNLTGNEIVVNEIKKLLKYDE